MTCTVIVVTGCNRISTGGSRPRRAPSAFFFSLRSPPINPTRPSFCWSASRSRRTRPGGTVRPRNPQQCSHTVSRAHVSKERLLRCGAIGGRCLLSSSKNRTPVPTSHPKLKIRGVRNAHAYHHSRRRFTIGLRTRNAVLLTYYISVVFVSSRIIYACNNIRNKYVIQVSLIH